MICPTVDRPSSASSRGMPSTSTVTLIRLACSSMKGRPRRRPINPGPVRSWRRGKRLGRSRARRGHRTAERAGHSYVVLGGSINGPCQNRPSSGKRSLGWPPRTWSCARRSSSPSRIRARRALNALLEAEFATGAIMVAAAVAAAMAGAAIPAATVPSPCAQRLVPAEQAVRRLH